jgi:hypothetical protein
MSGQARDHYHDYFASSIVVILMNICSRQRTCALFFVMWSLCAPTVYIVSDLNHVV